MVFCGKKNPCGQMGLVNSLKSERRNYILKGKVLEIKEGIEATTSGFLHMNSMANTKYLTTLNEKFLSNLLCFFNNLSIFLSEEGNS